MQADVHIVGQGQLGRCPAATVVDADSGDTLFLVNRDVMPRMPYGEQLFVLAHELGHRITMSRRETVADAFALGLTAGRRPRSLKSAVGAVASMQAVPASRVAALYSLCLQVDRQHLTDMKKQHLFAMDGLDAAPQPEAPQAPAPAAEAPAADADSRQAEQQALMLGQLLAGRSGLSRRPGLHIGSWFVSAELLVLAAILVCSLVTAARVGR